MALTFSRHGDVLEVREDIHSFFRTRTTWWYYDTVLWLCSLTGKQGETPTQHMTPMEIAWVREHYLSQENSNG